MEIDNQKIQKIITMPQNEFAAMVYNVVLQAGADRSQAQIAMSIAPMIQNKLKTASKEDLNNILKTVGEERVRDIFNSLDA